MRPESLYRTRHGRGRPATRVIITSRSAPVDPLNGEEWSSGGQNGESDGRHEKITVPSMVTVPPTDEHIFANGAELERWDDVYNKQLYSVLFVSTKGAATSFLVRFAGRSGSRQQPDGQVAWEVMA